MSTSVLLVPALASERWTSIDLYRDALMREFAAVDHGVEARLLPVNPDRGASWGRRQFDFHVSLPRALRRHLGSGEAPRVVHFLDQNYAWFCRSGILSEGIASVVTCHDLAPLRQRNLPLRTHLRYRARVGRLSNAGMISCDSAHTAHDVVDLLDVEPARVMVNRPGVDPVFRPMPRDWAMERVRRLGLEKSGPWVLHVGSNDDRKNLPVLLQAIARLRGMHPRLRLVKIGPRLRQSVHTAIIRQLRLGDAIIEPGWVDLDSLIALYNLADVLAMPSSYEGFGRPLLEAMACGTPCVAASATSLPEVAGDAALYHAASDVDGLAARLAAVLEDENLRASLAAAGPARARPFTWSAHAARLAEAYRRAAANR